MELGRGESKGEGGPEQGFEGLDELVRLAVLWLIKSKNFPGDEEVERNIDSLMNQLVDEELGRDFDVDLPEAA